MLLTFTNGAIAELNEQTGRIVEGTPLFWSTWTELIERGELTWEAMGIERGE